jgi:transposase
MPPKKHQVDHRLGRPSKLTPEIHEKIVESVRRGNYVEVAAEAAGIYRGTVFRWIQEANEGHPDPSRANFRDALLQARAEAEATMVSLVVRAAMGGVVTKEVTRTLRDGTIESETTYSSPDGRVGLEYLSRAFPDRWRKQTLTSSTIEHTGPGGGPVQIQQAERLTGLAARLTANQPKVIDQAPDDRLGP